MTNEPKKLVINEHVIDLPTPVSRTALELVAAERARHLNEEGWTPENDDLYVNEELPRAAAEYLLVQDFRNNTEHEEVGPSFNWPWRHTFFKPSPGDRKRELVKAASLVLAEIERLQRAEEQDNVESV